MLRMLAAGFAVAAFGAVTVVGVHAQAPTKVPPTTLNGCLKPGQTPGTFVLADASVTKQGDTAVGTSGAAKKTYSLGGLIPPGVDLSKHVNHKVEVVGAVSDSDPKAPSMNMHTFKHVAPSCS